MRITEVWAREGNLNDGQPYPVLSCMPDTFPINGLPTYVEPGATVQFVTPDVEERPWAQYWERYFEKGMARSTDDAAAAGVARQ